MSALILRLNALKCLRINTVASQIGSKQFSTTQLRCKWRTFKQSGNVEQKLQLKDKLPASFQLIYRAPLEHYVTWTKNISTLTVTVIGAIAGYQLATQLNYFSLANKLDLGDLVSHEDDLWYYLAGFILINLTIRLFVAKYPLRIYKDADKYVAIFESQLPLGNIKHYFQRGQVEEYKNFLNPWRHIMYRLGTRSSMLLIDYFKTPAEFHQLFNSK